MLYPKWPKFCIVMMKGEPSKNDDQQKSRSMNHQDDSPQKISNLESSTSTTAVGANYSDDDKDKINSDSSDLEIIDIFTDMVIES